MNVQGILLIAVLLFLLSVLVIHIIRRRRERALLPDAEEEVQDDMFNIQMGKYKVPLRQAEVDNFNAQSRKIRKALAKKYLKSINNGELVPIIENEKIIGYVTPEEKARHG